MTGRTCPEGTLGECLEADGSGRGIVPSTERASCACEHEVLDDDNFLAQAPWWGMHHGLDWLEGFVGSRDPARLLPGHRPGSGWARL